MTTIYLKIALAAACVAALAVALALSRRLRPATLARLAGFDVAALWLLTRVVPIGVIYFAAGFSPESDVADVYWKQAVGAISGRVPYRDFESAFAPLFPDLLAVPLLVWRDPRALIVWMTILEAFTIRLTLHAAGMSRPGLPRLHFLLCAFLAPGPLMLEVVGGQEDFLLWTFGLLVWLALRQSRDTLGGAIAAAAMLFTKATFVVPLAGLFGIARARLRFVAVIAAVGLVTLLVLVKLTGSDFLAVLRRSGNISPPQIWILLHFLSAGVVPAGTPVLSFVVIAGAFLAALGGSLAKADELRTSWPKFAAGWSVLLATMIVLSPKSQGAYFGYFALPALAVGLGRPRFLAIWVLTGALAVIEPSVFYRLGEQLPDGPAAVHGLWGAIDLGLQAVLVLAIVWIAWQCWRVFRDAGPA
jgi:hypothetical protein